jgi:hypothetical protein
LPFFIPELLLSKDKFADTKAVIRSRKSQKERPWVGADNFASATGLLWTTHHEHNAHNELLHWVL